MRAECLYVCGRAKKGRETTGVCACEIGRVCVSVSLYSRQKDKVCMCVCVKSIYVGVYV